MNRQPMRPRSIRATDAEWENALAAAERYDEILSEQIRQFLRRYAAVRAASLTTGSPRK